MILDFVLLLDLKTWLVSHVVYVLGHIVPSRPVPRRSVPFCAILCHTVPYRTMRLIIITLPNAAF